MDICAKKILFKKEKNVWEMQLKYKSLDGVLTEIWADTDKGLSITMVLL